MDSFLGGVIVSGEVIFRRSHFLGGVIFSSGVIFFGGGTAAAEIIQIYREISPRDLGFFHG